MVHFRAMYDLLLSPENDIWTTNIIMVLWVSYNSNLSVGDE